MNLYKKIYKKIIDLILSYILVLPITLICLPLLLLVFLEDYKSPIYLAERIGIKGSKFKLFKLRSMIKNASEFKTNSTKEGDFRITKVGKIIRKFKLDELSQIFNVINGSMSLVGPRPNTFKQGVELYTKKELVLLSVKPGITDLASIVFSDEAKILSKSNDPDRDYNLIIRPWKSRLGLFYIQNCSLGLDLFIMIITPLAIFRKDLALELICKKLKKLKASDELIKVCKRKEEISIIPPP